MARADATPELPHLGLGLGLRASFARELLQRRPALGFLELLTENHLDAEPAREELTDALADAYPIVLHGVSLNLGSVDPLDLAYLRKLAALASRVRARWVSDHLCWTAVGGRNSHDLLPLPYTEATLAHVALRVRIAQDLLARPLVIENPSRYASFRSSTLSESEFLARLCEATGCRLLVDVNNLYVTAMNCGGDPRAALAAIPPRFVAQLHLAGHSQQGRLRIDTHDAPVTPEVWDLYAEALTRFGPVSTLLERDARIPPLDALCSELAQAEPMLSRELELPRAA
jgi:hypothetical protein